MDLSIPQSHGKEIISGKCEDIIQCITLRHPVRMEHSKAAREHKHGVGWSSRQI